MVKLGKNEIVKRIAVSRAIIVEMEVLREHLAKDCSDSDKLALISRFAESVMAQNVMNIENNRNYYSWTYDGVIE